MAGPIPDNPDVWLRRKPTAAALNALGLPITPGTLATWASQGKGPPFSKFGRAAIYRWGTTLEWAIAKIEDARPTHAPAEAAA